MAAALQQNMKLGISLRLLSQKTRETGSTDPSQKHVDSEKLPSFPKKTTATMLCIGFLVYLFFFPNHNHSPICEPDQDPPLATISSINTLAIAGNISLIPSEDLKKMSDPENPVKIYLYDLPERFTYGVIEHFSLARGHGSSGSTYPSHQHKAEWHLFKDLTRPDEERVGSPVVRVLDPDKADLFYVPFFSSLSSVVNQGGGGGPHGGPRYSDEETQVALVEWLEAREHWKRNRGRDHVIVATDPNAYHKVMDRIKRSVLLVSDFGRLRTDQASLVKDVIVPYFHRIHSYNGDIGVANRNTLLFFMGARYRKEGGKIRNVLFQILENEEDVVIKSGTQSMANRRAASHGMHTSKFCLNPAGDTPSACRLFDSIVSLCVPVIVSDDIELPFEDVIDYTKLAIFVETSMALKPGFLVTMLRAIPAERILQYQKELQEVKNYFEYGNTTVNEIWRQVAQKQPMIKFMINRDKRLQQANLNKPDRSFLF